MVSRCCRVLDRMKNERTDMHLSYAIIIDRIHTGTSIRHEFFDHIRHHAGPGAVQVQEVGQKQESV